MARRFRIYDQQVETPAWQPTWESDVSVPVGHAGALATASALAALVVGLVAFETLSAPMILGPALAGLAWVIVFAYCLWRFIPEHRAQIVPHLWQPEAPEPHEPIIVHAAPGVRDTYQDDLWEFVKTVWDRREEYPRPWSLRAWEGRQMRSGTVVTRDYHARLMDPLLRGDYVLDYGERKSGRWNPKVTDFYDLARRFGLV